MNEKVVITGGAGFIGSNLVRKLLDENYSVFVLDDLSAGTRENLPEGALLVKMDICAPDITRHFEGAHTVFHLAAKTSLTDCVAHPTEAARVNVLGSVNVLRASVEVGVKHFVYADTSAEYEGINQFPSRTEEVRPLSVYACSKAGGALFCRAFSELHGMSVTLVRYFNVYGRAQDWRRVVPPVMSAFTLKLLRNERPLIFGNGMKRRDFIHVDDVNAFHLKLLREPQIRGKAYNLGSGQDFSILEIYQMIEEKIRSGLKPEFRPDLPMEALRTLADLSETVATGWKPQIQIEEGISDFIEYTRERLCSPLW